MKYIALTIGPIYKTLANAKTTREIWGASYFFSYVMKSVIQKVFEYEDIEFITPFVTKEVLTLHNGVGLFHDRIIIRSTSFTKEQLDTVVKEVLFEIEEASNGSLRYNFLKNYLQIHTIEIEASKIKNPILDLNLYLDSAELFYQVQLEEHNLILDFIHNRLSGSFLAKDAFGSTKASFESLPEIALSGFDKKHLQTLLKNDELEVYENTTIKQHLQPYHKYIAIVQADGDNMGALLEAIGTDDQQRELFSKALFDFCLQATTLVETFEGRMIYAGGDDLLFFAPVVSNKETIFSLLKRLDNLFKEKINPVIKKLSLQEEQPSLSFGLSITYYKFPLYEARKRAAQLLFEKAKSGKKNQIAYYVTKHSGQSFEGLIVKDAMFQTFLDMVAYEQKLDANFLHSIYTKIDKYKTVLQTIEGHPQKVDNFYENYFNEEVHHSTYKPFIEKMKTFTKEVYANGYDTTFLYATLRFKKFLLGDK
jgi:CRISPR-associated protein Cmr2